MPTYSYCCEKCECIFEQFYSFESYIEHPKCLECGSKKTHRHYQSDLMGSCGFVRKSDDQLKTVGDLANRNRDRLSNDQKIDLYNKHNNYKEQIDNKSLPNGMSRIKTNKTKNKWY